MIGKKLKISASRFIPLWVIGMHILIIFGMGRFQERASQTFSPEKITLSLRDSLNHRAIAKESKQNQDTNVTNSSRAQIQVKGSSTHDSAISTSAAKTFRDRDIFLNPKPIYPLLSRRMREQGAVELKLCIDERGHVESIQLAKSSGYQNLDRAAMVGVREWKFSALESKDQATNHCYHLPVHFRLET